MWQPLLCKEWHESGLYFVIDIIVPDFVSDVVQMKTIDGKICGEAAVFVREVGSNIEVGQVVLFSKCHDAFVELQNIIIGAQIMYREKPIIERKDAFYIDFCIRQRGLQLCEDIIVVFEGFRDGAVVAEIIRANHQEKLSRLYGNDLGQPVDYPKRRVSANAHVDYVLLFLFMRINLV